MYCLWCLILLAFSSKITVFQVIHVSRVPQQWDGMGGLGKQQHYVRRIHTYFQLYWLCLWCVLRRILCQCNRCDLFLQSCNVVLWGVYQSGAPSWRQWEIRLKSEPRTCLRSPITVTWNTSHWHVISLVDYLLIWLLRLMLFGIICEILNLYTPFFQWQSDKMKWRNKHKIHSAFSI